MNTHSCLNFIIALNAPSLLGAYSFNISTRAPFSFLVPNSLYKLNTNHLLHPRAPLGSSSGPDEDCFVSQEDPSCGSFLVSEDWRCDESGCYVIVNEEGLISKAAPDNSVKRSTHPSSPASDDKTIIENYLDSAAKFGDWEDSARAAFDPNECQVIWQADGQFEIVCNVTGASKRVGKGGAADWAEFVANQEAGSSVRSVTGSNIVD